MEGKQIVLSAAERAELEQFVKTGSHSARLVNRSKIILALDTSLGGTAETQGAVAGLIGVSRQTVNAAIHDFLAAKSVQVFLKDNNYRLA